jgi:hypothetical protein
MSLSIMPAWLWERPLGAAPFDAEDEDSTPRAGAGVLDLLEMNQPAERLAESLLACRDQVAAGAGSHCVSVEAPWGAGKTSFLHLVWRKLLARMPRGGGPVWVEFNAWQSSSMATGIWAAIAYRIGEALYRRVHRAAIAAKKRGETTLALASPRRQPQMTSIPTAELAEERLHWLQVASIVARDIGPEDWHPCLGLFADAPSKIPGPGGGWGAAALEGTRGLLSIAGTLSPVLSPADPTAGIVTAVAARALDAGAKAVAAKKKASSEKRDEKKGAERKAAWPSTWGVDTREFVALLGRLCGALVPHPHKWRLAVVIDDVSRVAPEELRGIFDALSYLRELDDALVLVTLDEPALAELEAQLPPHVRRQGEKFASKVIHFRYQLPPVHAGLLGRFGDRFLSDLGLPAALPAGSDEHPVRRLIHGGVRTPREMKRALAWMWMRLTLDDNLLAKCQAQAGTGGGVSPVLALLVDLHLFTERLLSAEELDLRARAARNVLLRFSHQPWDGQDWPDRGGSRDFTGEELDLVAWLRYLRLAQFAGLKLDKARLEVAQSVWARWCADLAAGDATTWVFAASAKELRRIVTKEDLPAVLTLFDPERIQMVRVKWAILISSSARFFWLTAEDAGTPTTFREVLDRWYDADALAQAVLSDRVRQKAAALAAILLHVLHPGALKEIDPSRRILQAALGRAVSEDVATSLARLAIELAHTMQGTEQ